MHTYTYLALGDSYTIGEAVPLQSSFPCQAVQLLRKAEFHFMAPEILAETGWTTQDLDRAIRDHSFLPKYDFVSLLIGVNNQFREGDVIEYKEQLEELLKKALGLANGKKDHVVLISIPDYGVTPFAKAMDREKITREIDVFNSVSRALSIQYKVHYIDITTGSRTAPDDTTLVARDGLHPSSKEYAKWARKLSETIALQLK
jgi:lysophospholipase L1-like esterase